MSSCQNLFQQDRINKALNLEKEGKPQDALIILQGLVNRDPNCTPCKQHMVRVTSRLEKETLKNRRTKLDGVLAEAETYQQYTPY